MFDSLIEDYGEDFKRYLSEDAENVTHVISFKDVGSIIAGSLFFFELKLFLFLSSSKFSYCLLLTFT